MTEEQKSDDALREKTRGWMTCRFPADPCARPGCGHERRRHKLIMTSATGGIRPCDCCGCEVFVEAEGTVATNGKAHV